MLANPRRVGLSMGAYGFEVPLALNKRKVIEQLRRVEGVYAIQNHHGRFVGTLFLYRAEELRQLLDRLNEIGGTRAGLFGRFLFPP